MENNSSALKKVVNFLQVWLSKFTKDRITILASGIVYTTLISIIPFVSFLVAFLSVFDLLRPFYDVIEELFTSIFGTVAGGQLATLIESYSKNASGLGIFGLISFSVTSVLLINKVWSIINQIYRSSSTNMSVVRRSVVFLTTLIVGVILLSAYFGVKSLLSSWTVTLFGWNLLKTPFLKTIRFFAPWVIGWLFLFFMIKVAPNAKVSVKSASLGAIVGTTGLFFVNSLFAKIISNLIRYSVIYGSFAAVFFFLLWVHIIWIVVFGSVVFSYVHQYRPGKESIQKPISPAEQLANGINVMMVIGQKYRDGKGPTRIRDITDRLLMNEKQLFNVLDLLIENGFTLAVNASLTAYVPAKPLEDLKVIELVKKLYGEVYLEQNIDTIGDSIATQICSDGIDSLGNLSVANLIERI
ncbi:MAG: YihY/virulence factor BrkB family protein [Sphaerochaetaceae bacterium]|jgi:membrane protein